MCCFCNFTEPENKSPSQILQRWVEAVSFFDVPVSHSHVFLSQQRNYKWQDLGPWIKICVNADVWEKISDPVVQYNPILKVYRKLFSSVVHTFRTVQPVPDTHTDTQYAHAYLHDTNNISRAQS